MTTNQTEERTSLMIRHASAVQKALLAEKNLLKGTWEHMSPTHLFYLLQHEVDELKVALWQFSVGECTAERVEEESADVGAFAAMIADVCRKKK